MNSMMDPIVQERPNGWPVSFAKFASSFVIVIGMSVLFAWTFYYWLPTSSLTPLISQQPNSALCFILAGISLWIRCEKTKPYMQSLASLCSSVVFLIGFLTLFQYFFQIDLGIDRGLFSASASSDIYQVFPVGRMPPLAATNFVLIGFTLFFIDNTVISFRIHQILLTFVILISFFPFLIHLYRIQSPTAILGFERYSQMPMLTISMFLVIGVGIFLSRPYYGVTTLLVSKDSGGVLTRRMIPAAIIIPIILGYIGLVGLGGIYYEAKVGISLLVMATILFFIVFIIFNAYLVEKADIKRKIAEQQLKMNQQKLQSILDHTSAVIYIYDLTGRYILTNRELEKQLHKSSTEILGKQHTIYCQSILPTSWSKIICQL